MSFHGFGSRGQAQNLPSKSFDLPKLVQVWQVQWPAWCCILPPLVEGQFRLRRGPSMVGRGVLGGTPSKTNILNPKNDGVEDEFSFHRNDVLVPCWFSRI